MSARRILLFSSLALVLVAMLVLRLPAAQTDPRLLHSEPSTFGSVLVFEENGERCLNFNTVIDTGRQTCMSLEAPATLVFSYTRMMIGALYVKPDPGRILIVGLGGASLQKALAGLLPDAVIDTVEVDPAIGKVAESYFGYRTGPRQRLFIADGREYIEQAHREGRQYDMVMLDAFDVDYIPRHLMTAQFLEQVKGILTPGGVAVANTFTRSRLYEQESATYQAVFGDFLNLQRSNRVIIAVNGDELPDDDLIARRVEEWAQPFERLGIQKDEALRWFARSRTAAVSAPILED